MLGWSIIGYSNTDIDYDHEDEISVSHRIIIKKVLPATKPSSEFKSEIHFVCRTQVKEMITPADILKVFESDFTEKLREDVLTSQEDVKFLAKLKEGIKQKQNGRYEMPLPFKEEERPSLPCNKVCAEHRLRCLEKRLKKDDQYRKDYVAFMEDLIARDDAERVPESEITNQTTWYIPHHGVYHPQKPGKIRVVFDCSAKFHNTSLNNHLLTGPDLTNTLVGVLCRFRKGQLAIMCDVERMFHQFHVAPRDQIQTLRCKIQGDLSLRQTPEEHLCLQCSLSLTLKQRQETDCYADCLDSTLRFQNGRFSTDPCYLKCTNNLSFELPPERILCLPIKEINTN